jgi:hypothetical protein
MPSRSSLRRVAVGCTRHTAVGLAGAGATFVDVLRLIFEPDVLVEVEASALLD